MAGEWQEIKLNMTVEGKLKHVRLFLPSLKNATEIDWIEISWLTGDKKKTKRWDFTSTVKAPVPKTNQPNRSKPLQN